MTQPMRRRGTVQLGVLAGIPVRVHITFLLLVLWVAAYGSNAGLPAWFAVAYLGIIFG